MLTRHDDGSVLALVPAAVLVLVILSAIAVDSAYVFLAQRALAAEVASVANDIAGGALDEAAFYGDGHVVLSADIAAEKTAARFRIPPEPLTAVEATVEVSGATVVVRGAGRVRRIFGAAIPGLAREVEITATSTATAHRAP